MGCSCWNTTEPKIGEKLPAPKIGEKLPAPKLVGRTANKLVQKVFELLMSNDNKSALLVYGMAGVGKTAIMMNVYNQLLESQANPYEKLIWVSGTHDLQDEGICSEDHTYEYFRKLQENMASAINFHLPNELEDNSNYEGKYGITSPIRKRAILLCKAFERFGNYLLFVDDNAISVHSSFRLDYYYEMVDFNRVVVISRSYLAIAEDRWRKSLHTRKVDLLPEKEAWELFVNNSGIEITPRMEDIAKEVVKECDGLPLTIVTIAEALKGKEERIWRETLQKLRCCITGMMDTRGTLYKSLKYQWKLAYGERLSRIRSHDSFFCVLYPKDWIILKKELRDYSSVVPLPGGYTWLANSNEPFISATSEVNFDDYHEWGKGIKMHPLYREFALVTSSQHILSQCGLKLTELPDVSAWGEHLEWASFMCNNISSISISPICPKLSTLFLNKNLELCSIANAFFVHIQSLKILDLRDNGRLESLPDSVSDLVNLRALRLSRCLSLKNIPSLAKLSQLIILELDETAIEELPQGIDMMAKLGVLHLQVLKLREPLPSKLLALLHCRRQLDLQI